MIYKFIWKGRTARIKGGYTLLRSGPGRTQGSKPPENDRNFSVHVDKEILSVRETCWKTIFKALLTTSIIEFDMFLYSYNVRDLACYIPLFHKLVLTVWNTMSNSHVY